MPEHLRVLTKRWQELHPRWEYRLWGNDDLDWLRLREVYDRAEQYVDRNRVGQFRSDIARYEILLQHGGFYADVDSEPLRPIDDAFEGLTEFAVEGFGDGVDNIGNALIACEPGAPVMNAIVEKIAQTYMTWPRHRRNVPAVITGPVIFAPLWREFGCYLAPSNLWHPYTYAEVPSADEYPRDFPDAYAVHHWEHIRGYMRRGEI